MPSSNTASPGGVLIVKGTLVRVPFTINMSQPFGPATRCEGIFSLISMLFKVS